MAIFVRGSGWSFFQCHREGKGMSNLIGEEASSSMDALNAPV